jgi:hypothetical protein
MATYKILYWQEIPSQVKAEDGADEVSLPLSPRFLERVDRMAMQRGLHGTDDFLEPWHWGDEEERDGSAQEVAAAVVAELEAGADW